VVASSLIATAIEVTSTHHIVSDCIKEYRIVGCSRIYHWC
jgi:hypothetical protein